MNWAILSFINTFNYFLQSSFYPLPVFPPIALYPIPPRPSPKGCPFFPLLQASPLSVASILSRVTRIFSHWGQTRQSSDAHVSGDFGPAHICCMVGGSVLETTQGSAYGVASSSALYTLSPAQPQESSTSVQWLSVIIWICFSHLLDGPLRGKPCWPPVYKQTIASVIVSSACKEQPLEMDPKLGQSLNLFFPQSRLHFCSYTTLMAEKHLKKYPSP